ncbi:MAG: gamma carbonic anhydrase family protein [Elusimicrobiota bacterium]
MIRTYGRHTPRIHPSAFVHDSAELIGKVVLERRSSVWPLCSIRGDVERIVIGERSNIQDLTVIHTRDGAPTLLGKRVTVGHRVVLHGARIGDGCLIGMGAVVMEALLGEYSLVAAGALVLAGLRVPPKSLVMGSPAKVIRRLKPAEIRHILEGEKNYQGYMDVHIRDSRAVFRSAR